ncbi:Gfo/Idh/MocA family protein [Peribacillus sp. SCS-37]|uniref:Gfo/Idh/MocA family protein n=1 Tax=Paraperibacillus esterisolvens TaxID=3115296 RepID=UPI0039059DBE
MIRTALLSRWHVHADEYADAAMKSPLISVEKVWDENPERGREWAESLGVPYEENLEKVLADPEIDAVIVASPTNMHTRIMLAAASNKKHIFTEKVLALSASDAREILQEVEEHGVRIVISLPRLVEGYYLYAQKALDDGLLGKLTTIRCRMAHNGAVSEGEGGGWLPAHFFDREECGGGAFIDLGAHPIYLANRICGPLSAVTAVFQEHGHEVDVNSAAIVEYESGALAILETGFVSYGSPFQLELYGTEGTIMIEDKAVKIKSRKLGEDWLTPDIPSSLEMPIDQWAASIAGGREPSITGEDAYRLSLLNELASISARKGRRVTAEELPG